MTADDGRVGDLLAADTEPYGEPSLFARAVVNNPDVLPVRMAYVDALRDAGSLDDHELGELVSAAVAANTVADTLNGHPTDRPDGTGRR